MAACCAAKGIDPTGPLAGEEIAAGPVAVARYLRLLRGTFMAMAEGLPPPLPGPPEYGPTGLVRVPVLPCRGMFDSILFRGFRAHVWLQPHVTKETFAQQQAPAYRIGAVPRVSLVLGAGNVSSIAPTDALYKLFHEREAVLLKMNPVNAYLGDVLDRAFRPLVDQGLLRIVYGGADVGGYAAQHPGVDDVHITGSVYSHEAIVWGIDHTERERRKSAGDPLLRKSISSELGNVTPWIVVPGPYTEAELDFQSENLAASIVNNASFNCIATKMIVTQRNWPQRARFLEKVQAVLDQTPPRRAYYPARQSGSAVLRQQVIRGRLAIRCPGRWYATFHRMTSRCIFAKSRSYAWRPRRRWTRIRQRSFSIASPTLSTIGSAERLG